MSEQADGNLVYVPDKPAWFGHETFQRARKQYECDYPQCPNPVIPPGVEYVKWWMPGNTFRFHVACFATMDAGGE